MQSTLIRRFLSVGVLALGVSAVAGCSMFSPSNPRYEPVPLTEYQAAVSAGVSWSVSVGRDGGAGFAPQVVGESVYAAAPNGSVMKVALATGAIQWRSEAGKDLSAGVGSDGRVTAVAARDGTVIAFDEQGREKWQAKASSQVDIPPAVGAGIVAVRSSDYRIQAFDAETGEALWNVQRPGPALALKTNMRMVIIEDMLLSGLPNGRLIAIDADSGAVQ
ncbi:MAG TPA: PQQ-binding-like beta-propeller repeat protein, partial [Pusillimonas sp.]|uniref:outer membrane protein assembly factor BamB family protein n=1 Tax=Pusillimonas sp. TaxID=3040095 RepID=UPI002C96F357